MKSLLALLAAAVAPCIALGQQAPSPSPTASPTPAGLPVPAPSPLASPAPAAGAASSPAAAGNAHEAAATVPLPGQAAGPNLEKNIPLIPETAPAGNSKHAHPGKTHPGSTPHDTGTFQVEQDIRVRVRMREAETQALNDPSLQADWAAAHHATTDPERRALLGKYYNRLYDLMIKIDPSIAQHANTRRAGAIARMKYTRLGDLTPAEDPFAPPIPDASGPNPPAAEPQAPPP